MIKVQPITSHHNQEPFTLMHPLVNDSWLGELILEHLSSVIEFLPPMSLSEIIKTDPNDNWVIIAARVFFGSSSRYQKHLVRHFRVVIMDNIDSNCLHIARVNLRVFDNARDLRFMGSNITPFCPPLNTNISSIYMSAWAGVSIIHDQILSEAAQNASRLIDAEQAIVNGAQNQIQIPCRIPRESRVELLYNLWKSDYLTHPQIDWSLVVPYTSDFSHHKKYIDFCESGIIPRQLEIDCDATVSHYANKPQAHNGHTEPYTYGRSIGEGSLCGKGLGKYGWYIAAETFADIEPELHSWGRLSHITEKSYKGFLQGSNTVVLGAPGHEAKLREQGFWLPDYGIDHLDGLERAQAIANLIPEMLADTRDYTDERIHNFRLVTDPEWLIQQAVGDLITKLSPTPGLAVP